jgi:hypothetical protein
MSSGVSVGLPVASFTRYRFSRTVRAFCVTVTLPGGGEDGRAMRIFSVATDDATI